jgi:lipopolysaccharide biosynthesis glycosyltransferase
MTSPHRHDQAVAFCVDRNYFNFALFMIRQIAFHNPNRRFDFVVASQDALEVPGWAAGYGIRMHRIGTLPNLPTPARFRGSLAPYFRILLPLELQADYRRILYLDADMFVEGGDFSRLLEQDLGPHPFAAARDAPSLYLPNFRPREFVEAGVPLTRYANTGTLLIDTASYVAQEVARRAFMQADKHPSGYHLADQSLFNLALRGNFAELSPAWNWQLSGSLPLVTLRYPVFLRHFIGVKKPHSTLNDPRDARFHQAYAEFFALYAPEELKAMVPPYDSEPLKLGRIAKLVLFHLRARPLMKASLARFKDPYQVLI